MPVNDDGTLRAYNASEIAAFRLRTRGIRDGSNPEERYSPDGSGCTRKWMCDWAQRFDVIKHLVGEVTTWNDSGTTRLTRTWPQSHPTFTQWICVKARISGHRFVSDDTTGGAGNKSPQWEAAEITAEYEMVPFRWVSDADAASYGEIQRYVTKPGHIGTEITTGVTYLTMPGGIVQYKTSGGAAPHGKPIPFSIGYTEVEERFSAIWRRVPETMFTEGSALRSRVDGDPVGGTRPWKGTTNSTALFGRPIGTCLLEGVEPKLLPDPIGSGYSWDIKYTWLYKPQTHYYLRFFDPAGVVAPGYYQVSKSGKAYVAALSSFADDDSLFPLRDHATGLFKVSA